MKHIIDDNFNEALSLSEQDNAYLEEGAKWAKFIAIIGFVTVGIMAFIGIIMGISMNDGYSNSGDKWMVLIYIIMTATYFGPMYYLYSFANQIQDALASNNQQALTTGLQHLKSMFKFIGILIIVTIVCYIIGIIFMVGLFSTMSWPGGQG